MDFDSFDKRMRVFETAHDHCVLPGIWMVARLDLPAWQKRGSGLVWESTRSRASTRAASSRPLAYAAEFGANSNCRSKKPMPLGSTLSLITVI